MIDRRVDVAIIGVGTAGMAAYKAAKSHTPNVVVIEGRHYGTTCASVGCMPSKLLIAASKAAEETRNSNEFGIHAETVTINGPEVMARVQAERNRFVQSVIDDVESWPTEDRIKGMADFIDDHTLLIDQSLRIMANQIIIATGSSSFIPPGWKEMLGEYLVTSNEIFEWKDLPKSLAVIGTGAIGLELAQAFHNLGVRVRLYGKEQTIGLLTDPAVQQIATQLIASHLPLTLGAQQISFKIDPKNTQGPVTVITEQSSGNQSESFDFVLVATGRIPNVKRLQLQNTSMALNNKGLPVVNNATCQTDVPHIFMAGDVNNLHPVLHEAADDGRIAGNNAGLFPNVTAYPRRTALGIVFSQPQIMITGQNYQQLTQQKTPFITGEVDYKNQGRSRIMGVNEGILHIYAHAESGKVLGAEMIGPDAEHFGHLLSWAIQAEQTVSQMLAYPYYHPTTEESIRTALTHIKRQLENKTGQ